MKKSLKPITFDPIDILLKTESQTDRNLLGWLSEYPLTIRRKPTIGLVMMTVTDSNGQAFHLGEVLVTEAEVSYNDKIGYAQVIGNQPQKALVRACAAAILESGDSRLQARLKRFLWRPAGKIRMKEKKEKQRISSTRVNFEVMTQW
jgi:phosphonate C-P lyase system protein PhnG